MISETGDRRARHTRNHHQRHFPLHPLPQEACTISCLARTPRRATPRARNPGLQACALRFADSFCRIHAASDRCVVRGHASRPHRPGRATEIDSRSIRCYRSRTGGGTPGRNFIPPRNITNRARTREDFRSPSADCGSVRNTFCSCGESSSLQRHGASDGNWLGTSGGTRAALADVLKSLRASLEAMRGTERIAHAPSAMPALDAWGDPGDALPLMRAVKHEFDPKNTLNPGRFVGGI